MAARHALPLAALIATTAPAWSADPAPTEPAKPAPAAASIVPAIDPSAPVQSAPLAPPPINLLQGRDQALSAPARAAVDLADRWKDSNAPAGLSPEGKVIFRFAGSLPTVVCAPLYVCDIQLEPGELVNNVNVGDAVRWLVTPASTGVAPLQTTHVIIKVTDIGLSTDLIVSTSKRSYVIKLVSRKSDWMPEVAFSYPEDEAAAWAANAATQLHARQQTVMADTGQNIDKLDFDYAMSGDKPDWRPVRVYTDGSKTYIQFPHPMQYGDSPALVELGNDGGWFSDPSPRIVNYRIAGDRYVVDKILTHAALISGVGGEQDKVEINRTPGAAP